MLDAEKALTRQGDAIATQRRMLPMVEVSEPYAFTGQDGSATLLDLFKDRHQLVVYHFMFHPDWEDGCPSCTAGRERHSQGLVLDALSDPSDAHQSAFGVGEMPNDKTIR